MQPSLKEQPKAKPVVQDEKGDKAVKFDINKTIDRLMIKHKKTLDKLAK